VVAHEDREAEALDAFDAFFWGAAVTHDIAKAGDDVSVVLIDIFEDGFEGINISVDIRDDGDE